MNAVVLLVVLPFVGAMLALFGKVTRLELPFSVAAVLPIGAMAACLAVTYPAVIGGGTLVYALGGWPEPIGIALHLDGLAWVSSALTVVVSAMVVLASFPNPGYRARYFFFLMMLVAGMQTVVLTGDIFTMFVGFEVVAISAYVLIAFDRTSEGLLASLKYLLLSSVGILFFLFGVFLVYRDFGSLSFAAIASSPVAAPLMATTSIHFAVAALCVGIGVRTAFIPFHTWLPEAHAYAPHPVSALLSGVLIKVSFFAMVRIIAVFRADYLSEFLLWVGGATALLAVTWAVSQTDAKRLLAYHSISQMGYVLAAFGAATSLSATALFAHAMHHALFKSLLFIVAGTAISLGGSRNVFRLTPIGRRAPLLAAAFLVGALSIAGVPPFNGFASKQLVSATLAGHPAYVLLWITSVGTAASFLKVSRIVMPGPIDRSVVAARSAVAGTPDAGPRAGFLVHVPATLLALLCLATGLFARPVAVQLERLLAASVAGRWLTAARSGTAASGAAAADPGASIPASFFSTAKLLDVAPQLLLGVALYLLVMTKPGKRVTHRIERVAPELRTVLLFFVLGLGAFAVVAYF